CTGSSSLFSTGSCPLDSGLDAGCGDAARRGSLRSLSPSTGAAGGFFSAGSVAVARAESELIVRLRGAVGAEAAGAAAGDEGTGGRGGVTGVDAAGAAGRGAGAGAAGTAAGFFSGDAGGAA